MTDYYSSSYRRHRMTREELVEHFRTSTVPPEEVWEYADEAMEIVYSILPLYTEEITDYDSLLQGKTAIALGFSNNEKRYLKRNIDKHGGKFRFTKNGKENFFIVHSNTWLYDMLYALGKAREEGAIIVDYDHFVSNFEEVFSDEEEERRKTQEREAEAAKPKNGPIYKACSEEDLACIPNSPLNEISLEDDVFHVIGKIDYSYWDSKKLDYYSVNNQNAVYKYIDEKGGRAIKKDSDNITCIVYGKEPAEDAIKSYLDRAKFIDADSFLDWLFQQTAINKKCREFGEKYKSYEDPILRPYQQEIKERIFKKWNSYFNIMLQLPTGAGKTVLFTSIINDLNKIKETKILILAHRKELIDQISTHLTKYNIEHGLITSGRVRHLEYNVQVASIQTITHKDNQDVINEIAPKFIIIDEAHHSLAKTYTTFWKKCQDTWKLGVTATPYRLNRKPLKGYYDKLIMSYDIEKFISLGYLAEYTLYVDNPNSDLSKAIDAIKERSSTGDYKTSDLLDALNVQEHIQKLVLCYLQYVNGKKGIVYAVSKEHAYNICQAYQKIGVAAEYVDSETNKTTRQDIIERFRKGEITVMVNVNIFSEGFDCPDIEFIQLARPTWSLALYLQQVGRGMRISSNKEQTIILDNAALYTRFSFPSSPRGWEGYFEGNKLMWELDWDEDDKYNRIQKLSFNKEDLMIKVTRQQIATTDVVIDEQNKNDEILTGSEIFKQNQQRLLDEKEAEERRLAEEIAAEKRLEMARIEEEEKRKARQQRELEEKARRLELQELQKAAERERKIQRQKEEFEARKEQLRKEKEEAERRRQERLLIEEQEERERNRQKWLKVIGLSILFIAIIVFLYYTGLLLLVALLGLIAGFAKK